MIKILKILLLVLHLLYGGALVVFQVLILRRTAKNPQFKMSIQRWYQKACRLVGLRVTMHGTPPEGAVLMVANHISWLDIPLIASLSNPRFLSKSEVRKWPIIGWAGEKLDTLFITRGKRSATEAVSAAIAEGLEQQNRILIFPEGTTTNGAEVGFLYPRLFGAAIYAEATVQPVVIHYTDDNGIGSSSDLVPYVDGQTLVQNLWLILACRNLQAQVYFLDVIEAKGVSRKELASGIQRKMQDCLAKSQAQFMTAKPLIHK